MLIIDDILLFPVDSFFWLFRQIHNAAQEEIAAAPERITAQLSELYMLLATDAITQEEFDAQESQLLDLLDQLQGQDDTWDDAEEFSEDDEDDEEDFSEDEIEWEPS